MLLLNNVLLLVSLGNELNSLYRIFNFQMEQQQQPRRPSDEFQCIYTFNHVQSAVNEPSAAWRHTRKKKKNNFHTLLLFYRVKPQEHTTPAKKKPHKVKTWKSLLAEYPFFFLTNDDGWNVSVWFIAHTKLVLASIREFRFLLKLIVIHYVFVCLETRNIICQRKT